MFVVSFAMFALRSVNVKSAFGCSAFAVAGFVLPAPSFDVERVGFARCGLLFVVGPRFSNFKTRRLVIAFGGLLLGRRVLVCGLEIQHLHVVVCFHDVVVCFVGFRCAFVVAMFSFSFAAATRRIRYVSAICVCRTRVFVGEMASMFGSNV